MFYAKSSWYRPRVCSLWRDRELEADAARRRHLAHLDALQVRRAEGRLWIDIRYLRAPEREIAANDRYARILESGPAQEALRDRKRNASLAELHEIRLVDPRL